MARKQNSRQQLGHNGTRRATKPHKSVWVFEKLESREMLDGQGLSAPDFLQDFDWAAFEQAYGDVPELQELFVGDALPRMITVDNPNNHIVDGTPLFDGVVTVETFEVDTSTTPPTLIPIAFGSGALLWTGRHILTAAHLFTDVAGALITDLTRITYSLAPADGGVISQIVFPVAPVLPTDVFLVHPFFTGFVEDGFDVAVVVLPTTAPAAADRYNIYTSRDEVGQTITMVGYGASGTGNTGPTFFDGLRRVGMNRYDAVGERLNWVYDFADTFPIAPDAFLAYDFDNGLSRNDAFGRVFGLHDLGLGTAEASTSFGDSGGPVFINGRIAGITSWGFGVVMAFGGPDVTFGTDTSFGEFSLDTRVSTYAAWIVNTVTNRSPVPRSFYISTAYSGLFGGSFPGSDVIRIDVNPFFLITGISLVFQGSSVGLEQRTEDVDAFTRFQDGTGRMILSTTGDYSVQDSNGNTISGDGDDLLLFTPDFPGALTGNWSLLFDGSQHGLNPVSGNIDSVSLRQDGTLAISIVGPLNVGGIDFTGSDLLLYTPLTPGDYSSGTWSMFFDGSDVELDDPYREDLNGASVQANDSEIFFVTRGEFTAQGVFGTNTTIGWFVPTSLGDQTSGVMDGALEFVDSLLGATFAIDALHVERFGGTPITSSFAGPSSGGSSFSGTSGGSSGGLVSRPGSPSRGLLFDFLQSIYGPFSSEQEVAPASPDNTASLVATITTDDVRQQLHTGAPGNGALPPADASALLALPAGKANASVAAIDQAGLIFARTSDWTPPASSNAGIHLAGEWLEAVDQVFDRLGDEAAEGPTARATMTRGDGTLPARAATDDQAGHPAAILTRAAVLGDDVQAAALEVAIARAARVPAEPLGDAVLCVDPSAQRNSWATSAALALGLAGGMILGRRRQEDEPAPQLALRQ